MAPILVCLKGSPGSGKSTLARELARRLGWALIDKDDARDAFQSLTQQHPGVDWNSLSYDVMFRYAATQLACGNSVIFDSPLARRALFDRAREMAEQARRAMFAAWLHVVFACFGRPAPGVRVRACPTCDAPPALLHEVRCRPAAAAHAAGRGGAGAHRVRGGGRRGVATTGRGARAEGGGHAAGPQTRQLGGGAGRQDQVRSWCTYGAASWRAVASENWCGSSGSLFSQAPRFHNPPTPTPTRSFSGRRNANSEAWSEREPLRWRLRVDTTAPLQDQAAVVQQLLVVVELPGHQGGGSA